tara:strand:+ start:1820 stop:3334 length:1515 start_codon:yes stop_codon:yes gene_type:complete
MQNPVSAHKIESIGGKAWALVPLFTLKDPDPSHNMGRGLRDSALMIVAAAADISKDQRTADLAKMSKNINPDAITLITSALNGKGTGDPEDSSTFIEVFERVYVSIAPDGYATIGIINADETTIGQQNHVLRADGKGGWQMGRWGCMTQTERDQVKAIVAQHAQKVIENSPHAELCTVNWSKAVNCSGVDAGCLVTFQPEISRVRRSSGTGIHISSYVKHALDKDEFETRLKASVEDRLQPYLQHLETLKQISVTMDKGRGIFLSHGYDVRFELEEGKGLDDPRMIATHYGNHVGAFIFAYDLKTNLTGYEKALAILEESLARITSPESARRKLTHLQPESVKPGMRTMSSYMMELLRYRSKDPLRDAARILAHGERKWTAQDFSDLFGCKTDIEMSVTVNNGQVRCSGSLGNDVTIKNRAIVLRKLNLPEILLQKLKGSGTEMRVREIIDHPCLPNSAIERIDFNTAAAGDTVVIWPLDSVFEKVEIKADDLSLSQPPKAMAA